MYLDPEGTRIVLTGSDSDQFTALADLNKLTDHTLSKDSKGVVTIRIKETKKLKYKKGNKLITRLINSSFECRIDITSRGGNQCSYFAGAPGEAGLNSIVTYNPDTNPDVLTVNPNTTLVSVAKRPSYIGFAHELIHADRAARGGNLGSAYADYKYRIGRVGRRKKFYFGLIISTHMLQKMF